MRSSPISVKKMGKYLCLFAILIFVLSLAAAPVTAVSQYVQVSVSPSTVIHGNSFTASIDGIPVRQYTISITGTGTAPQITPGQVGVSGSGTTATVTTDASGRRTVAFTTTRSTSKQQFKIMVTNAQDASDYDSGTVWITEGTVSIIAATQPETVPPTTSPATPATTEEPTTPPVTAMPTEEETETAPGFLASTAILALAALVTPLVRRR